MAEMADGRRKYGHRVKWVMRNFAMHNERVDKGRRPTEEEALCLLKIAEEYWRSPYAAPEQKLWALDVDPELISVPVDFPTRGGV